MWIVPQTPNLQESVRLAQTVPFQWDLSIMDRISGYEPEDVVSITAGPAKLIGDSYTECGASSIGGILIKCYT